VCPIEMPRLPPAVKQTAFGYTLFREAIPAQVDSSSSAGSAPRKDEFTNKTDWSALLGQIWALGKTESNLAGKGVAITIEGETHHVRHNRRGTSAILRIQPANDPSRMTIVIIESAYRGVKGHITVNNYQQTINEDSSMRIKANMHGRIDAYGEFVVDLIGTESAGEIHQILESITSICDQKNGISRYRIRWQGELVQLLPYSLYFQVYELVRVSPEGDLIVCNYSELTRDNGHAEKQERESGIGLQKAINIREGIIDSQDPQDIHIYISDQGIKAYIRSVAAKSGFSRDHPYFQRFYDFYCSMLLQIKKTRDELVHLVPNQENEPIRIVIGWYAPQGGPDGNVMGATYQTGSTIRGEKRYLSQNESHSHAYMVYPPFHYDFVTGPDYLVIEPPALRAETRHHVHELQMDLTGKKLPAGLLGLGATEVVDEMQYFVEVSRAIRKNMLGAKRQAEDHQRWWSVASIVDSQYVQGINGHIFARHIIEKLADKFSVRKLSSGDVERIDKCVFDLMSNVNLPPHFLSWPDFKFKIDHIAGLRRSQVGQSMIEPAERELRSRMNLPDNAEIDWHDLSQFAAMYEIYKMKLSGCCRLWKELINLPLYNSWPEIYSSEIEEYHRALSELEAMAVSLREKMLKYQPFHAPDGKDYHSPSAYYLNPEIIYHEIIKRHPELSS